MTDAEKAPYKNKAEDDTTRYREAMVAWRAGDMTAGVHRRVCYRRVHEVCVYRVYDEKSFSAIVWKLRTNTM